MPTVSGTVTDASGNTATWSTSWTEQDAQKNALTGAHMHAVWDRYGSAFGPAHVDVLTKFKAAGVKVIRLDAWWEAFEPSRGEFKTRVYNGKLDDTITWCRDHGIQVILCVTRGAQWTTSGAIPRLPDKPADCYGIGVFLGGYYASYGNVTLEFWNEPDLTSFDTAGPRPAHYVACLQQFHAGVNSVSGVPVCFAAPSSIAVVPGAVNKTNFIGLAYDEMNRLGGIRPYDMIGVHVYPGGEAPDVTSTGTQPWRLDHLRYLFSRMDAEGDIRPVAITEGGYSAHPNTTLGGVATPGWEQGVSETVQRDWTIKLINLTRQRWPNRVNYWVIYNDWEKGDPATATTSYNRHQYGFGILRYADRAITKPVYQALST